jgi:hypothetical protein
MADINGALAQCLSAFAFAYHVPLGFAPPPPPHITGQPPAYVEPAPPQLPAPAPNGGPPPAPGVGGYSRDQQRDAVRQAMVDFCTRYPDDWACHPSPPPRRR